MESLTDVLEMENSKRRRIQRIVMTCAAETEGAPRSLHEVQIDFASHHPPTKPGEATSGARITVRVTSDATGWASSTLSEIEEQVERTWPQDRGLTTLLVVAALSLLALLVIVIAASSGGLQPGLPPDIVRPMWLRSADLDRVEAITKGNRTITEEELRDIASRQLRNVLDEYRPSRKPGKWKARPLVLGGVPLTITLIAAIWLLARCYPSSVFLWGDEVGRYAKVVQQRRVGWNVIILGMVVGVLAGLLAVGVTSWLPPE